MLVAYASNSVHILSGRPIVARMPGRCGRIPATAVRWPIVLALSAAMLAWIRRGNVFAGSPGVW